MSLRSFLLPPPQIKLKEHIDRINKKINLVKPSEKLSLKEYYSPSGKKILNYCKIRNIVSSRFSFYLPRKGSFIDTQSGTNFYESVTLEKGSTPTRPTKERQTYFKVKMIFQSNHIKRTVNSYVTGSMPLSSTDSFLVCPHSEFKEVLLQKGQQNEAKYFSKVGIGEYQQEDKAQSFSKFVSKKLSEDLLPELFAPCAYFEDCFHYLTVLRCSRVFLPDKKHRSFWVRKEKTESYTKCDVCKANLACRQIFENPILLNRRHLLCNNKKCLDYSGYF